MTPSAVICAKVGGFQTNVRLPATVGSRIRLSNFVRKDSEQSQASGGLEKRALELRQAVKTEANGRKPAQREGKARNWRAVWDHFRNWLVRAA